MYNKTRVTLNMSPKVTNNYYLQSLGCLNGSQTDRYVFINSESWQQATAMSRGNDAYRLLSFI